MDKTMSAAPHATRHYSLDERVQVAPYDPAWPSQAAEEIGRLRAAFGNRIREIQHIGSTAVPGMVSKPVIDLQAAVRNAASAMALVPVLETLDYEDFGEAGVPGRRYFRRRRAGFPSNVHLVWARTRWRDNLTLRDYLCTHPQEADYYSRQKREILAQGGSTLLVYSDAKGPLLKELLVKARVWGEQVKRQVRLFAKVEPTPVEKDQADEAKAIEAFYAALTATIRLGDQAGFETAALEELRQEAATAIVEQRNPRGLAELRGYEEPLRTAGLIYLLDEYCAEQGNSLDPGARRKLKFEVEAWQTKLRRLEEAGRDFFSAADLDAVQTKEDLAGWFRRHGVGKEWWLLGH